MLMRCMMVLKDDDLDFCQRVLMLLRTVIVKTPKLVSDCLRLCAVL